MPSRAAKGSACVGVSDHAGWAVLISVVDGELIDRRRVDLIEPGLPSMPYHHDAQGLPIAEALALVERVRVSTERCARASLDALAAAVPVPITALALRACPPLPASVAERISLYQAQTKADSVMYREALAQAGRARGWSIHWYDARHVLAQAANALGRESIEDLLKKTGAALGPPWRQDHRQAMAAALALGAARV